MIVSLQEGLKKGILVEDRVGGTIKYRNGHIALRFPEFSRYVTNMEYLFAGFDFSSAECQKSLLKFDTSNVETMDSMFRGCRRLTSLDLSSFDTSKVEDMQYMFSECDSLTDLDISSFQTSKVGDMGSMFFACASLERLDLAHFDTSRVKCMNDMFRGCLALKSVDVSSFQTAKVRQMNTMFAVCPSLRTLDLSSFDSTNLQSNRRMFFGCDDLRGVKGEEIFTSAFSEWLEHRYANGEPISEFRKEGMIKDILDFVEKKGLMGDLIMELCNESNYQKKELLMFGFSEDNLGINDVIEEHELG